MAKTKALSSRGKKDLEIPPIVLKVKRDMKEKGDANFSTMKKLTESKDPALQNDLKKMWLSLQEAEEKKFGSAHAASDESWVHYFILHAASYSDLPRYYYLKLAEREQLVKDIKKHSKELIRKLQYCDLDCQLAYSAERQRISFYNKLTFAERREADKEKTALARISDFLNVLVKRAERDIGGVKAGRADDHLRARLFVCDMAQYFEKTYKRPMRSVLLTAADALHDTKYDDDDGIRKILEREKPVKDAEDFLFLTLSQEAPVKL